MNSLKILLIFVLYIGVCLSSSAANLSLHLPDDLPDEISKNIRGYLGDLPEKEIERTAFVYSAKNRTNSALNALGYYRANIITRVERDVAEDHWQLFVEVQLNKPTLINSVVINIEGDALHDDAFSELIELDKIKTGDVLNHGNYEKIKSDLTALGLQRGYFDGFLRNTQIALHQSFQTADIEINYVSGKRYQFGEVNFDDFAIESDILEKLIPFEYGDDYTVSDLHKLQNQLQLTRYFSNVMAIPNKDDVQDNKLPINVALEPAKSHSFDFGVGYTTDTKLRISAAWRTPLINRYGHRQETRLEYSKVNPTGRFIYSVPLTHPLNDLLQFQVTLEDDEYADIDSKYLSVQVGRVRNEDGWIRQQYVRYLSEEWNYDDLDDDAEYLLPGLTWSRTERAGPPLDPSHGFSQYYNIEGGHDGTHSEVSFVRTNARWKYITTLMPDHRIVARAELGFIWIDEKNDKDLAPSLRFYAGGDQSIRGFSYQSIGSKHSLESTPEPFDTIVIGGTRLAVASLEYQYYFTEKWRGALFTDGGSAGEKGDFDAVYSVGTGLHYISPVGAIRVDFGYSLSRDNPTWRLHFSLGTEL